MEFEEFELPAFPNRAKPGDTKYDLILKTLAAAGSNGMPNTILGQVVHYELDDPQRVLQETIPHLNTALQKKGAKFRITAEKVIIYRLEEID